MLLLVPLVRVELHSLGLGLATVFVNKVTSA